MGLFDFLKGKNSGDSAIALDIGTEFVKALIFQIVENQAKVIGVGRQRQRLTDMQGGTVTDIEGVIKNCQLALDRATDMAKILPNQVVMGIAGELVKGNTTTVHYTRTNPNTKINYLELKKIIDRVQDRGFHKTREILATETGHAEIDVRLVNAAIVNVKIDGYKVTNPIGFVGKEVRIEIFNAFAPLVHLDSLQSIASELGLELLVVAAEPYAVARASGMEEENDFSAIFLDIGGGTTDLAIVRSGGLDGTKMFALGGRSFTKRIANSMNLPFHTAEEMKINYAKGNLDAKTTKLVKQALHNDCAVWLSGVELSLSEFSNIELLPSRILLCGGGSSLPEIKEQLETNWYQKYPFAKKPRVEFIPVEGVSRVTDVTQKLTSPGDITPMALANLSLDFAGEETIMEGMLRKIVTSMNV